MLLLRLTAYANVLRGDNYLISPDLIGTARDVIQSAYGCKVIITQGDCGNIKPKYEGAQEALDKMAYAVMNAVKRCADNLIPRRLKRLSMLSHSETFFSGVPTFDLAKAISDEAMCENGIDVAVWIKEVARLCEESVTRQGTKLEIHYFVVDNGCFCSVARRDHVRAAVAVEDMCGGGFVTRTDAGIPCQR